MKISQVLAAAGFVLFSSICAAQLPPGVTPEMIAFSLPEEGAPKAEPGPYAVTSAAAFGAAGLKVFRPANLDSFPKRDTLPVVVWGNGGCAIDNPRYAGFLETIASHGFLVITTVGTDAAAAAAGAPAPRPSPATAASLAAGIDWAGRENQRDGSPLKGKIQITKVAVMGQSCGGRLSIELGADPRVGTIGVFNAGLNANQMDLLAKLHGPVLLINGHERDFMMAPSKATFDAIAKLPAFYGSRHGAGHTATAFHVGGGEFANVASNWVLWQFKGDKKAAAMFVGKKCALCTNANWDTEAKGL
ncbi:MAG: alpha/beta hydrolase [Pseudomonadota bacterium]